jgi:thiosulfate/3-mercaptopyruvate sulfurtransferase
MLAVLRPACSRRFPVYSALSTRKMTSSAAPLLLEPSELARVLRDKPSTTRVLDGTWFMPNIQPPRDPKQEFAEAHIKGAQFWPVDDVADKSHPLGLAHMLPTSDVFARACCLWKF